MTFIKNNSYTLILIAAIIMFGFVLSNTVSAGETKPLKKEYVYETFEITSVKPNAIVGDILSSSSGDMGGEGVFLDNSIYPQFKINKLKKGDIILVVYNKSDYDNLIWDNIVDIKIMKTDL
jgi:hypothetical protein